MPENQKMQDNHGHRASFAVSRAARIWELPRGAVELPLLDTRRPDSVMGHLVSLLSAHPPCPVFGLLLHDWTIFLCVIPSPPALGRPAKEKRPLPKGEGYLPL